MPKGLRFGVQNISQNGKKGYFGVNDVAKKIKKIYTGDSNDKAQLGYIGELGITWWGNASSPSNSHKYHAATAIGNYAVFAGGYVSGTVVNSVDAYSDTLTLTNPSDLDQARFNLAATSVGNYALFGGGYLSSSNLPASNKVDAYNSSLTHSTATNLGGIRSNLAAVSIGTYALFGGGESYSSGTSRYSMHNNVYGYNTSLTRSIVTSLTTERSQLAATSVGNYALFGGGTLTSNRPSDEVTAYNMSLTKIAAVSLQISRESLGATSVGNYALFAGGRKSTSPATDYSTVDVYDTSLTRTNAVDLSTSKSLMSATTLGNYAMFGGSDDNIMDIYDKALTHSISATFSESNMSHAAACTVGKYALWNVNSTVDVYEVA